MGGRRIAVIVNSVFLFTEGNASLYRKRKQIVKVKEKKKDM